MNDIGQILTAVALAAALVAWRGIIPAARRGPVAARLRRFYGLIALLLALRLLLGIWPAQVVVSALMIVSAWLPFSALRLGEELVRRHAPRLVKLLALGGALTFTVLAITLGLVWSAPAIIALALFQMLVIAAMLIHLMRNRNDVSLAERRAVDMIALAFVIMVPLVLTDFQRLLPDLPVRGGAFAALVLVLATSRLMNGRGRPARLLADIAVMAATGALVALAAIVLGLGDIATLSLAACAAAGAALVQLIERFTGGTPEETSLIDALATSGGGRAEILSAHPLLANGLVLDDAALADLPGDALAQLADHRVISPRALSGNAAWGGAARELLDRHAASHLIRLSQTPPRFLAVMGGSLGEERLDAELELVAQLLERQP